MTLIRSILFTLAAIGMLAIAGCQSAPSADPVAQAGTPAAQTSATPTTTGAETYRLGAGDRLRITVFGHTDLSGEYEVDGSGAIAMPLIGDVASLGLSTRQLEQSLIAKYSDGLLRDPDVSAEVINYRPFYILGEVRTPGEYPYTNGLSALNAVAAAGGFTYRARKSAVFIKRAGSNTEEELPLNSITMVQPGDTLRVAERIF